MGSHRRLLRRVAGGLDAPHAARVRIVEELVADLEALHDELLAQGLPAAEARRRATAALEPSPEVLAELGRLHRPLWTRWRDRYGGRAGIVERAVLALLTLPVLASCVAGLAGGGLLLDASRFLWPVLLLFLSAVFVAVVKGAALFLAGESDAGRARRWLDLLLLLPIAGVAVGTVGSVLDLWVTAGSLAASRGAELLLVIDWVRRSAAVLATALTAMLVSGLAWMALSARAEQVAWVERALQAGRLPGEPAVDLVDLEARRQA